MVRPRLLDLFCGAGGAAVGYHRAGFEVVGVDHVFQPNYPYEFHQEDAITLIRDQGCWEASPEWRYALDFDAIHASPPCQRWTRAQRQRKNASAHPDLVTPLRPLLEELGLPYVIENVEFCDALHNPVLLCGSMFDLDVQYHRLFETNWGLLPPWRPCRHKVWAPHRFPGTPQGTDKNPGAMVVNRMASGVTHDLLARALEIDWIPTRGKRPTQELSDALPPVYTQFVGDQLLGHVKAGANPCCFREARPA